MKFIFVIAFILISCSNRQPVSGLKTHHNTKPVKHDRIEEKRTSAGYQQQVTWFRGEQISMPAEAMIFWRNAQGCFMKVRHLRHDFKEGPVHLWIRINKTEETIRMVFNHHYGPEYRASISCDKNAAINVQFAFDLGRGRWDNNHGEDYRVSFQPISDG